MAVEADFMIQLPLELFLGQQRCSIVHQKAQIVEIDVFVLKIRAQMVQTAHT